MSETTGVSRIPNFGDAVSLTGDGHLSRVWVYLHPEMTSCRPGYAACPARDAASSVRDAASFSNVGICDTARIQKIADTSIKFYINGLICTLPSNDVFERMMNPIIIGVFLILFPPKVKSNTRKPSSMTSLCSTDTILNFTKLSLD
jgi:hypothetical protein